MINSQLIVAFRQTVAKTSKAVNTNARLSRNKVKKTVAKTKIEAKKMTRKAGTQLNKKKRALTRSVNKTTK
ncbi:MAG: hypothetical protein WA364_20480 [Candidatus Nitrosopolaris sp.]